MSITDAWLKANLGRTREDVEEISDRDGMGVRASPKGKLVFQMRYRYAGKPDRLDLGSYPKMSLKEARDENDRLRGKLEQGQNPKVVRAIELKAIREIQSDTLKNLFTDWYEKYAVKAKPAHHEILRSFEIHVLPTYGELPAAEVTLHHWLEVLEKLAATVPMIADRVLTNAKQMLRWAVKRRRLASNPLVEITAKYDLQIVKGVGNRAFSDEELVQVWNATNRSHVRPRNKLFVKLCAVYGCRHTELRKAKKIHFDLVNKIWTVPPENHKKGKVTKKPLLRPITREIEPLVRQALAWAPDSEYVFPGKDAVKMKGCTSQISLPYIIGTWLKKNEKYTMPHWSIKAFRKTARTNFSTLAPPHIAEIMLGHKLPGVWEVYDQHGYLKEQAEAYSAWCRRIMRLIGTDDLLGADQWPKIPTFRAKMTLSVTDTTTPEEVTKLWESYAHARALPMPQSAPHPIN